MTGRGLVFSTAVSVMDCEFVISARCLASFTGQIISTGPVVGSVSRIMTQHVFRVCTLLGCLFRTRSIHKGRNYFVEGEY